jgi:hypothetical protein
MIKKRAEDQGKRHTRWLDLPCFLTQLSEHKAKFTQQDFSCFSF